MARTDEPASSWPAPASGRPAARFDGVTRAFGDLVAVRQVSLDVPSGAIVGLVGPSGCGKTTLLRMLVGLQRPSGGRVEVLGRDPADRSRRERQRVGYMPQIPVLFPNLSLQGNLRFVAAVYGVRGRGRRQRLRDLLEFVELQEHRHTLLCEASGGMQRRLTLAATLVHDPELLVLDEPTAGIDPIMRSRFWERFRHLRDRGRTLIVSTQYVGEAAECDLVCVMLDGAVLVVDTPEGLVRRAVGPGAEAPAAPDFDEVFVRLVQQARVPAGEPS